MTGAELIIDGGYMAANLRAHIDQEARSGALNHADQAMLPVSRRGA